MCGLRKTNTVFTKNLEATDAQRQWRERGQANLDLTVDEVTGRAKTDLRLSAATMQLVEMKTRCRALRL